MHGVTTPSAMIEAWRPFTVKELAPKIDCPLLAIYGEAEYAESKSEQLAMSIAHFLSELRCPAAIHEFTYEDGWAATHCQIGGLGALQAVIFNWLDRVLTTKELSTKPDLANFSFDTMLKYHKKNHELLELAKSIRISTI
jgi:hypothetical protein